MIEFIHHIIGEFTSSNPLALASILLSLIVMEGLLSVDNALVIAAMVSHLPGKQKKWALTAGLMGAYVGRGMMLFFAAWLYENEWVKTAGALYLIYLGVSNVTRKAQAARDPQSSAPFNRGFWKTVAFVEVADMIFSIDNVVVAVALSPKISVVLLGVFIGILTMRLVASVLVTLIERHPILDLMAYIIVGYIGTQLLIEVATGAQILEWVKFLIICTLLGIGLAWERWQGVRTFMAPGVKLGIAMFQAVYIIFRFVFYPFFLVARLRRGWTAWRIKRREERTTLHKKIDPEQ